MKKFKIAEWDNDAQGDSTCKELFKVSALSKKIKKKKNKAKSNIKQNKNMSIDSQNKNIKKNKNKNKNKDDVQNTSKKFSKKLNSEESHSSINSNSKSPKIKKKSKLKDFEEPTKPEENRNKIKRKQPKLNSFKELTKPRENGNIKKKKSILKDFKQLPKPEENIEVQIVSKQKKKQTKNKIIDKKKLKKLKLKENLDRALKDTKSKPILSLRDKMMEKLKGARFRYLNEQIYTSNSREAQNIFKKDPDAFKAYHEGYRQQINRWPLNPLDVIIKTIRKMPKQYVVADFGCGDAKLAKSVVQTVHSFDLVAANESITACDMAHVPLEDNSVDVAVFCLSLMGTNLQDYLLEANRVLKIGGVLKIVEVESRFDDADKFIEGVQYFGFKKSWKDLSHNLFYFMDFKKETTIKNRKKLPTISLHPCLYKKR